MKINKFISIKYILTIIIIMNVMTIISCSSFKKIITNQQNPNLKPLDCINIKNHNQINDPLMQSAIKNLQTINIIYFPLDQYHILQEFFIVLDIHSDFLRNNPLCQVKIEGHTDERGTPEYNIALGERRAYSVKKYLQSKGVLSNQIDTVSYGKEKPIAFGHTEQSYSKNRRVVLLYQ